MRWPWSKKKATGGLVLPPQPVVLPLGERVLSVAEMVLARDDHTCALCGKERRGLQVIKVDPAGEAVVDNLMAACGSCQADWAEQREVAG